MNNSYRLPTDYLSSTIIEDSNSSEELQDELVERPILKQFTEAEFNEACKLEYEKGLTDGYKKGVLEKEREMQDTFQKETNEHQKKLEILAAVIDQFNLSLSGNEKRYEKRLLEIICAVIFKFVEDKLENRQLLSTLLEKSLGEFSKVQNITIETSQGTEKEIENILNENGFKNYTISEEPTYSFAQITINAGESHTEINLSQYLKDYLKLVEKTYLGGDFAE